MLLEREEHRALGREFFIQRDGGVVVGRISFTRIVVSIGTAAVCCIPGS